MAVTREETEYIAKLAHLQFTDEELAEMTTDLNSILEYMSQLNSVDTEGVEPLAHPIELEKKLRSDTLQPSIPRADALKNAPDHDDEYFIVPKVIKQ